MSLLIIPPRRQHSLTTHHHESSIPQNLYPTGMMQMWTINEEKATSYIKQAFLYPGAMIATPIVAALMFVAIGGGILDDAIVGVPESLTRWWKGTLTQKKRVQVFASEENTSRSSGRTRKPSLLETAFEQLEMHARKQRRKRLAEQAAASLSIKPMDKQSTRMSPPVSSPRVIGTRRRRSRGASYDMEMQNL